MAIGTDCIGSCKSNYHTITTAPGSKWFEEEDWNVKILDDGNKCDENSSPDTKSEKKENEKSGIILFEKINIFL